MAHTALAVSLAAALVAPANLAPRPHRPRLIAAANKPNHASAAQAKITPKTKPVAEPSFQAFPYPIETHVLKNGLRVAFVTFDSPGLVAYYTLVRVGSRNEPEKGRSGYAHFFEHMMFRGTKAHPADEYNSTMTRLGLDTNASTGDDQTIYHLYGPSQSLPTIIEYEADRFANLDYSEPAFRTEAGAILGEYAKSASSPDLLLEEKMVGTAFTKHTYKHTSIGFLDDVKAMPEGYKYSREFFNRYYKPDNTTVIVAGDFDHAKALALIEKDYGAWKGKSKPAPIPVEPPQTKARRAHLDWPRQTLPLVWVAWHVPGGSNLKAAATATLLNGYLLGETSALYQDLILGRRLCDSLEATWSNQRDPSLFGVIATVKKVEDVPAVEQAIAASARELAAGKIDRARLEAVRSNLKFRTALSLDTADRAASTLARNTSVTGDLNYVNKLFAQIDRVSAADLTAYAKKWLSESNKDTVTLSTAQKEVAK